MEQPLEDQVRVLKHENQTLKRRLKYEVYKNQVIWGCFIFLWLIALFVGIFLAMYNTYQPLITR